MIKSSLVLAVVWVSRVLFLSAESCKVKYNRVGCFVDDQKKPRPLPVLLSSDREGPDGKLIDWKNWDNYIKDLVCRCAKRTAKLEYAYFGLQFYGECWSGHGAATYARAGTSQHCVTKGFNKCVAKSNQICVGESHTNFVYMLSSQDGRCRVRFDKVGCYSNNHEEPYAYPVMLFTDNNPESGKYSNVSTGFTHWNSYILDLACRCATRAKQRKFPVFSLQNFGECWAGPKQASDNENPRIHTCIGQRFSKCTDKDEVCVGRKQSNFVFKIY